MITCQVLFWSADSSHVSDWRFQSLEQLQESSSDEDDEFFDAEGIVLSSII
ncbi:hypothetical protein DPMN_015698 [Dreissena polymorpha]|uniref:Uncharacterized protein n=1 Tax=Dreissena polymorpha TaxID=45954 RepID=A0A9D4ND49_DREPO|nr:hypothetical protein DPMN_015698 [Dreissena polymorpha]